MCCTLVWTTWQCLSLPRPPWAVWSRSVSSTSPSLVRSPRACSPSKDRCCVYTIYKVSKWVVLFLSKPRNTVCLTVGAPKLPIGNEILLQNGERLTVFQVVRFKDKHPLKLFHYHKSMQSRKVCNRDAGHSPRSGSVGQDAIWTWPKVRHFS